VTAVATEYPRPTPRPYQVEARDNFLAETGNALIKLPTGTGKSLLSAMLAQDYPGERVLFLVHTDALAYQTCETYLRYGLWPNVEKADEYHGTPYIPDLKDRKRLFPGGFPPMDWFKTDRVWVSTIQTFKDRVEKYREGGFDLVICDEAHRSLGMSWVRTIEQLLRYNPAARVLGLTATPLRGDGQSLAKLFPGEVTAEGVQPKYAYRMDILDGIGGGWLVDIECERATLAGVDESMWKVGRTGHGKDLTDESVAASMDNAACIESIAHEVLDRADGRKGILFLPGVNVTESVCAAMNALRPGCAVFVHGKVPKRENRKRRRMIRDGDAQFILGCDQLIEGFDIPDIALVVMARFTAQRGRYEQMLGRGLRVLAHCIEGLHTPEERRAAIRASKKPTCRVIDFANGSRFKLVGCEDILLKPGGDEAGRAEFVRKHRDPNDKRKVREQLDELELLYEFGEAARKAGGPPRRGNFN
jgi:superfamily II DNA or RNA helicase